LLTLDALDDNIGDTVSERGSRAGVTLLHALCKLNVGLLASVV
jgi:hypothetical protein